MSDERTKELQRLADERNRLPGLAATLDEAQHLLARAHALLEMNPPRHRPAQLLEEIARHLGWKKADFPDGVERFVIENDDDDDDDDPFEGEQCARCGSSVGEASFFSFAGTERMVCLSTSEWCEANPIAGREHVKGAGR